MHRLSMVQALSIWGDLMAAFYGQSSFGGDTAELYMYRLMPDHPTAREAERRMFQASPTVALEELPAMMRTAFEERTREACESLYAILRHFEQTHEVHVAVNGVGLGDWVKEASLHHRVHVRISPGDAK